MSIFILFVSSSTTAPVICGFNGITKGLENFKGLQRTRRKLWNLGYYFLPSQTYLLVVILTAGILLEVIVLLRKLLGKITKSGGQALAFLLPYAITRNFSEAVSFSRWTFRQAESGRELMS